MNPSYHHAVRRALRTLLVALALAATGAFPAAASVAATTGSITIIQSTIPEDPQDFHFTSDAPGYSSFALDDDDDWALSDRVTISELDPARVIVSQATPAVGWGTPSMSCDDPDNETQYVSDDTIWIDFDAGEVITCTFGNVRTTGDISVRLDTVPDDPIQVDVVGPFGIVTLNDDGSDADFIWPNLSIDGLEPGLKTFIAPAPSGWEWTSIVCSDPDGGSTTDPVDGEAAIDLDAGEVVDCTYTLAPIAPPPPVGGDMRFELDSQPDGPTDVVFGFVGEVLDFTLDDDGAGGSVVPSVMTYEDMDTGVWTLAATIPSGWLLDGITCTDPDGGTTTDTGTKRAVIDLDPSELVTCRFVIKPVPAPPVPPTTTCNDKPATIVAAPGVTSIRGTQGNDVIVARSGNVKVDARGGDDTVCTGAGDDTVSGGAGNDWVDAGDGTNTVDTGAGHDVMFGGSGNDTLLSGMGNDDAFAGEGNNLVSLGAGDDDIVTGAGDDRISGGKDFDTCNPGAGQNGVRDCEVVLGSGQ